MMMNDDDATLTSLHMTLHLHVRTSTFSLYLQIACQLVDDGQYIWEKKKKHMKKINRKYRHASAKHYERIRRAGEFTIGFSITDHLYIHLRRSPDHR